MEDLVSTLFALLDFVNTDFLANYDLHAKSSIPYYKNLLVLPKSKIKKNAYRTFSLMWPASMQIY